MNRQLTHLHHVTHASRGLAETREAERLAAYFTRRLSELWDEDSWRRGILGGPWLPSRLGGPEIRFFTLVRDLVVIVDEHDPELSSRLDFEPTPTGFVEVVRPSFPSRVLPVRFEPRLMIIGSTLIDLAGSRCGEETLRTLCQIVAQAIARPWGLDDA